MRCPLVIPRFFQVGAWHHVHERTLVWIVLEGRLSDPNAVCDNKIEIEINGEDGNSRFVEGHNHDNAKDSIVLPRQK